MEDVIWIPISEEDIVDGVLINKERHDRFMSELNVKPMKFTSLWTVLKYYFKNQLLSSDKKK